MRKIFAFLCCCALAIGTAAALPPSQVLQTKRTAHQKSGRTLPPGARNRIPVTPKIGLVKIDGLYDNGVRPSIQLQRFGLGKGPETRRIAKAPFRVGSTGSTIYGWLTSYNDPYGDYPDVGLNEIDLNGTYTTLFNRNDAISGGGFIRDGRVCLYSLEVFYGSILGAWYREFDIATGEKVVEKEIDTLFGMQNVFVSFAYDPADDMIYGYAYNEDSSGYTFSKASGSDPVNLSVVSDLGESAYTQTCTSMTFNAVTGKLTGVNLDKNLVEIDGATGAQTVLMSVSQAGANGDASGLVYSPVDGAYVWNCRDIYGDSYLYSIKPQSGELKKLANYQMGEVFAFFVTPDEGVDLKAPCAPVIEGNTFAGTPDLSGSFTLGIPAVSEDGSALSGALMLSVKLDADEYLTKQTTPGEKVTVSFTDLEEGVHSFLFSLSDGTHVGKTARETLYLGNDEPEAPEAVYIDETGIHWTAVTTGVNHGYLDLDALTYDVALDDDIIAEGVKGTDFAYTFPAVPEAHTAAVRAVCNGKEGWARMSAKYISGDAMQLPVYFRPTASDAELMNFIDSNADNSTWNYLEDSYGNSFFQYAYNPYEDADDWIIFPAIDFPDGSRLYSFSLEAWSDDYYPERFEVKMGEVQTTASMTTTIIQPTEVQSGEAKTYEALFEVPEAGKYYIAIHGISRANNNFLYLRNINIRESNVAKNGPEAVTGLTAAETAPGDLSAQVEFVMPAALMTGEQIDASATLSATVKSNVATASVSGRPGERVSVTVATEQGPNKLIVQPALGEAFGREASVDVYTGVDVPGRVNNLKASLSEDNYTVHLTWEPPTEGENGGYVAPTGYTYLLMGMVPGPYGDRWGVVGIIGDDVLEYDHRIDDDALLKEVQIGVMAMNAADMSGSFARLSVAAGKPYELPLTETFEACRPAYNPLLTLEPDESYADTHWGVMTPVLVDPEYDTESGGALVGSTFSDAAVSRSRVSLPKFSTVGATNVVVTLDYAGNAKDLEVYAAACGTDPVFVGRISDAAQSGNPYATYRFTLPAQFNDRRWVEVYLDGVYGSRSQNAVVARYDIRNYVAGDFGVTSLYVPSAATLGTGVTQKAVVTNFGYEASRLPECRWQVKKGGQVLAEATAEFDVTDELTTGGTATTEYSFVPDADMYGDVTVEFSIVGDDANMKNNALVAPMRVGAGQNIVVTDLSGSVGENGVTLTWTAPVSEFRNASFEKEAAFMPNPSMIEGFRNIDGDGCDVLGYESWEAPNAFKPAAFTVWSAQEINAIIGTEGIYSASDGDKFLIAFCPGIDASVQPDADDWLISPEVRGGSEVSFDLRPIAYRYGAETLEVMVSTGDDDPDSFELLETIRVSGAPDAETVWEKFCVILPADAKYFALHYVSNDKFGIQLDNINYVAADAPSEISGYDVYRNNTLIEEHADASGSYVDAAVPAEGVHTYHVVPVKESVRGLRSNTAVVDMSAGGISDTGADASQCVVRGQKGCIVITGCADGDIAEVFAPDGVKMASRLCNAGRTVMETAPGIYIVRVASCTAKVTVR